MSRIPPAILWALGALTVLFLWWEADAAEELSHAIGRAIARLAPLAIGAWVVMGAFGSDRWSEKRESAPAWAKFLAIVFAALMAAWVFLFWGDLGDLIGRWFATR